MDGATVCGQLTVEATASLDSAEVTFGLDGTDMMVESSESFTWEWHTEGTSNGLHSLRAAAWGADGLAVQRAVVEWRPRRSQLGPTDSGSTLWPIVMP